MYDLIFMDDLVNKKYEPIEDNNSKFWPYTDQYGKPVCKDHGAMNKVAPGIPALWRCLQGQCRYGARQVE